MAGAFCLTERRVACNILLYHGKLNRYLLIPQCAFYYSNQSVSVNDGSSLLQSRRTSHAAIFSSPLTNIDSTRIIGCHYRLMTGIIALCVAVIDIYVAGSHIKITLQITFSLP